MRARMYRDDLDRVVDEIENSEVMWLGIQNGVHGYDEIAIEDSISVRSEVARLTRLYDKVVKNNTMNDRKFLEAVSRVHVDFGAADNYMNAVTDASNAALRARPGGPLPAAAVVEAPAAAPMTSAPDLSAPVGVVVPPVATPDDPDAAPASAPPKPKTPPPPEENEDNAKDESADESAKPKEDAAISDTDRRGTNGARKANGIGNGTAM